MKASPSSRLSVGARFLAAAALTASFLGAAWGEDCGADKLGVARVVEVNGAEKLSLGLQSYPRTLALADRELVLTFDDGPSRATTPAVLDALKEQCARATFFLVGRNAARAPELVERELAEGHGVGHHSFSHPAGTLRLMSAQAAKADIDKGIAAVDRAGGGGAREPATPFFRFPGFADTPELVSWLHERGVVVFGSDLWVSDWLEMTPQAQLELALARVEAHGKGIVLFHDTRPATAKTLPGFLRALKARGYKIVHVVAGKGPTPIEEAKPGWTSTTEPIIAKTLGKYAPGSDAKPRGAPGEEGRSLSAPIEPTAPEGM